MWLSRLCFVWFLTGPSSFKHVEGPQSNVPSLAWHNISSKIPLCEAWQKWSGVVLYFNGRFVIPIRRKFGKTEKGKKQSEKTIKNLILQPRQNKKQPCPRSYFSLSSPPPSFSTSPPTSPVYNQVPSSPWCTASNSTNREPSGPPWNWHSIRDLP